MKKKVEIYSKSNCSYCVMAMNFFDSKNISYDVYSADDPKIFKEMMDRNPQARTQLQTVLDMYKLEKRERIIKNRINPGNSDLDKLINIE